VETSSSPSSPPTSIISTASQISSSRRVACSSFSPSPSPSSSSSTSSSTSSSAFPRLHYSAKWTIKTSSSLNSPPASVISNINQTSPPAG
jgi:hypothetical protein